MLCFLPCTDNFNICCSKAAVECSHVGILLLLASGVLKTYSAPELVMILLDEQDSKIAQS